MYEFIKTIKQLVVSLHFISEDLTFDAAHKERNSFQGDFDAAHKERNSFQGDFMITGSQFPKHTGSHFPKHTTSH